VSAERAVVTFAIVRLAADIAADNWPRQTIGIVAAQPGRRTTLWIAAVLTIICLAAVLGIVVGREAASGVLQPVTVMTRNLYLGGGINRPIRAALDRSDQNGVPNLGHANHELREVVDRTKVKVEASCSSRRSLPRSPTCSASRRSRFGHGSMQLDNIGRTNATEVDYDLFRGPARSWQVAVSATTSFRSSPEIVPSVVDGQHWILEAVSGSTL
jgi:hypothetical protein